MIHRIAGVPKDLMPGEYAVRYISTCGDIINYEYVEPLEPKEETDDAPSRLLRRFQA